MLNNALPYLGLLYMGGAWGLGFSLAKLAAVDGTTPIGIAFWQCVLAGLLLLIFVFFRRTKIPLSWELIKLYLIVGLLGAAIPTTCFYYAAPKLSAGVLSITVTLVPILTYALALLLRTEFFSAKRVTGILFGAISIFLLVSPENSLPSETSLIWVLLGCVSSLCYAIENIYLATRGSSDVGPIRLACGMHISASIFLALAAKTTDSFFFLEIPIGSLELIIIGMAVINATAYALFVICIEKSGPLFASQVGYIVTLAGVFWGIIIFNESHSIWVWVSLVTMLIGLMLVSPKKDNKYSVAD